MVDGVVAPGQQDGEDGLLPQPLGADEVRALVQTAIAETGASSPKQMGLVMRVLMPQVRGRADGKVVSEMVRTMLAGQ